MNPSDDQQSDWQFQPDQPQATQPPVQPQSAPTDYPTQTYEPATAQDALDTTPQATAAAGVPDVEEPPVQWTANEYIDLPKGTLWYVVAVLVILSLIAIDILLLKSYTFSILVVVMSVALIIYARRPPREIQYTLSGRQGLYVGEKLYHLTDFRSFGLIEDDGHHSIVLIPVKRFDPAVSVYFPEAVGEQIVDILGQRLPMETLKLDLVDIVVRKLRL